MKKILLPILYTVLILGPILLGGALLSIHLDEKVSILPVITITEVSAAAKPADITVQKPSTDPKTINVWVTAYSSTPEETDDSPFITATNKTVQDGFIAANFLPFGTKVKIPELFGDKIFTVEDRMSRRKDNFMDVWMSTKEDAVEFGIHQTNVVVVEMGTIPNPIPDLLVAEI